MQVQRWTEPLQPSLLHPANTNAPSPSGKQVSSEDRGGAAPVGPHEAVGPQPGEAGRKEQGVLQQEGGAEDFQKGPLSAAPGIIIQKVT